MFATNLINFQRWHVFFGKDEYDFSVRARIKLNEAHTGNYYATTNGAVVTVALLEDCNSRSPSLNTFFYTAYALAQKSRHPRAKQTMELLKEEITPKELLA